MSEQDIRPVSAVTTGTFSVLKLAPENDTAPGNARPESGKDVPVIEKAELDLLAQQLNIVSQSIGRDLRFQIDMESGSSVIQVLDRDTGEIIRQIPPEKAKTYVLDRGDVALRLFDDQI